MLRQRVSRGVLLILAYLLASYPLSLVDAAQPSSTTLQSAFSAAAAEFNVPESILLSVSYNVSRWEDHAGQPSIAGGYGPMHLLQATQALPSQRGNIDTGNYTGRPLPNDPLLHTLDRAAQLLGISPATVKTDPAQNIRGGAALLAQYGRDTLGQLPNPNRESAWYGAVARYSGAKDARVALEFADLVYAAIQKGASRTTSSGQLVSLPAKNVVPDKTTANSLNLSSSPTPAGTTDCPPELDCEFIPAAYQLNSTTDPTDYGNYDLANREVDGLDIRYIVIHDTEVDYNTTLLGFENSLSYTSAHYVLRSVDGHVAQMVDNKNVAWHAGNWYVNMHAIGLEHEGVAIEGASWYNEQLYQSSARLVRYLAAKYKIPLDRAHIIGHDDIPGPTPGLQAGMHWDPGPFWDWSHYLELLNAPLGGVQDNSGGKIVTIVPNFATNQPAMTYCYHNEATACHKVPTQPANFVYLYSAPDFNAPLITNPYLSSDPTLANNWANKAVTGQQFYRVEQQGDWDAIYYSGQKAWLYNPGHTTNTAPGSGLLVTPKAGLSSIAVYGRSYPEASAYPAGISPQSIVPIYTLPAGQVYVAKELVKGDYYYALNFALNLKDSDHQVIKGKSQYYQIFFNHRFGYVKASEVDLV